MFERLWFRTQIPLEVFITISKGSYLCDFDVLRQLNGLILQKKLQAFRFELQNLINHSLLTGGKITQMFCF